MKKLLIIFSIILCFTLNSCNYNTENTNVIYRSAAWEIHRINDSTLLCIPFKTDGGLKPYLLDLNQFNRKNIDSNHIFEEEINNYNNDENLVE